MDNRFYAVIKAFFCRIIYRLQDDKIGLYLYDCKLIITPPSLATKPAHCN